ncbi:MAG TPA: hypothetical protein GXZ95_05205 [Mollicutes bacterium]|nr:hypothetical protein [Mollicutes bacterium]
MRESIGGAFLIKIMIVFIIVYNSVLAIAVNYAMAFRVKNKAVDLLEQYEGCKTAADKIIAYVNTVGYYRADTSASKGIKIDTIQVDNNNRRGYYYEVTTFIQFDFPFVGRLLVVPIKGETKIIYGISQDDATCPAGSF